MPTATRKKKEATPEIAIDTKVKHGQIKKGDLHAFIYWAVVDQHNGDSLNVHCVDGDKFAFKVHGKTLSEGSYSADQFHRTEKVSMTKCAEMLIIAYNRPFTVCFDKQDGTERVLRGRLVQPEPLLGRSQVEDLDIDAMNPRERFRLVDHRTLKWLIIDGVKYEVK